MNRAGYRCYHHTGLSVLPHQTWEVMVNKTWKGVPRSRLYSNSVLSCKHLQITAEGSRAYGWCQWGRLQLSRYWQIKLDMGYKCTTVACVLYLFHARLCMFFFLLFKVHVNLHVFCTRAPACRLPLPCGASGGRRKFKVCVLGHEVVHRECGKNLSLRGPRGKWIRCSRSVILQYRWDRLQPPRDPNRRTSRDRKWMDGWPSVGVDCVHCKAAW